LHGRQPAASARTCVAVDCLAELVAHNGVGETMELVRSIRADPRVACVAAYLAGGGSAGYLSAGFGGHDRGTDSPLAAASLAVRKASSAYAVVSAAPTLTLTAVPDGDGERSGGASGQPDAVLAATHARPTGRGRSETDSVFTRFGLTGDSVSTTFAPASAAVMDALTDAMKNVGGVDGIGGGGVGAATSSSAVLAAEAEAEAEAEATAARRLQASVPFNLGVNPSREEADAKASVVLPFEHQGAGRAYDEGNFLAYLPRDAGGARGQEGGAGRPARGHIMYVRDSDDDGEAPDSDEELDEDIDI